MRLRSRVLAFLFLLLSSYASAPAAAAPTMVLDLGGQGSEITVAPGATVEVTLTAWEIPPGTDGLGLFGFGFSLLFDPVLSATDPILGPLWDGTGFDDFRNDPGAGDVGLTSNRFFEDSGPSGDDILLGTLSITVPLEPENVTYVLDLTYFTDVGDNILFDGIELDRESAFFNLGIPGIIMVTPEPATAALMLAGLAVLAARRRPRAGPGGVD